MDLTHDLTTDRLVVSPLRLDLDAADLHAAFADPLVMWRWEFAQPSADPAETRQRLAARLDIEGSRLWTIRRRQEPAALGLIGLVGGAPVPGLTWMLRQDAWSQGIMSEAAAAVVTRLFDSGVDRVEVWVDAENPASMRVARRCGLTERGRMSRRQADGSCRETVVLGRLRDERPGVLYGVEAVLPVRDVAGTAGFLTEALGCELAYQDGNVALVRSGFWTTSFGLHLVAAESPVPPATVYPHGHGSARSLCDRVRAAGGRIEQEPQDMPWARTEFTVRLPDGHRLVVGCAS